MLVTYATIALAFGAAISVLCLWPAVEHFSARRRAQTRLARFGYAPEAVAAEPGGSPRATDLLRQIGSLVSRRASREHLQALNRRLLRAGMTGRPSIEEILGTQVLSSIGGLLLGGTVALPLAALLGQGSLGTVLVISLLALVLGGALGWYLPLFMLDRLGEQRRNAIDRLLPNAVDVLTVSLEAGLGFDTAIAFLCERGDNPLLVEFRRYLADLRLGRSRREALEALVERTRLASVNDFAAAVMQADELGTGLARTLQTQTYALRASRRVRAEERARQAPIKLLFPIVVFIMPVLFIVIVGPALLTALSVLGG